MIDQPIGLQQIYQIQALINDGFKRHFPGDFLLNPMVSHHWDAWTTACDESSRPPRPGFRLGLAGISEIGLWWLSLTIKVHVCLIGGWLIVKYGLIDG